MQIKDLFRKKEYPIELFDLWGNKIYYKTSTQEYKCEYDGNNREIYFETADGYWNKHDYDSNGNVIYFETSDGYWCKAEFDSKQNEIYFEDSDGEIRDNRSKEIRINGKEYSESTIQKALEYYIKGE